MQNSDLAALDDAALPAACCTACTARLSFISICGSCTWASADCLQSGAVPDGCSQWLTPSLLCRTHLWMWPPCCQLSTRPCALLEPGTSEAALPCPFPACGFAGYDLHVHAACMPHIVQPPELYLFTTIVGVPLVPFPDQGALSFWAHIPVDQLAFILHTCSKL